MEISKLSGIYEISNKINGQKYIGHSINITLRWYLHIDNLFKNIHPNNKLQEDFNKYGLTNFNFSILELIDGKDNLIIKEQEYLNSLNFNDNYNIYNSSKSNIKPDIDSFIDYITSKWLITDIKQIEQRRIYKEEDKQEIINKAFEYNVLNLYKSRLTFNRIINYINDCLEFNVITKRSRINKKQYRYKMIVDDYMNKKLYDIY